MVSNVRTSESTEVINEHDAEVVIGRLVELKERKYSLVWRNIFITIYVYPAAVYGCWLMLTSAKFCTFIFTFALLISSGIGVTAGAHRLWTHRSYKAKLPLRILLLVLNTVAVQDSVIVWGRDHRVHHKYSETDADPCNASRGFFFSHVGWLLCRKHPDVIEKGKGLDFSDLTSDPILAFQRKYYFILATLAGFVLPTVIPMYCWDESIWNAFFVAAMLRWTLGINFTFLVNSAAHLYGNKAYDANIGPCENPSVAAVTLGEGWHNYHHIFPWDYKTGELGDYSVNFTTAFIDFFAWVGWAYDLKSVSTEVIKTRVERTGDGSHTWGWGDKDQGKSELDQAIITHQLNSKRR